MKMDCTSFLRNLPMLYLGIRQRRADMSTPGPKVIQAVPKPFFHVYLGGIVQVRLGWPDVGLAVRDVAGAGVLMNGLNLRAKQSVDLVHQFQKAGAPAA